MTDGGEVEGKVAFITGAAHGQGRAPALALAKAGAQVAAFDGAQSAQAEIAVMLPSRSEGSRRRRARCPA